MAKQVGRVKESAEISDAFLDVIHFSSPLGYGGKREPNFPYSQARGLFFTNSIARLAKRYFLSYIPPIPKAWPLPCDPGRHKREAMIANLFGYLERFNDGGAVKLGKSLRLWGILLVAGAILSACGKESSRSPSSTAGSGPIRWENFPVTLYIDKAILQDSESKRDLDEAMSFWHSKANRTIFQIKGEWDSSAKPFSGSPDSPGDLFANVLFYQNPWDMGEQIAGKTVLHSTNFKVTNAIVLINPGTNFCAGNCENSGDEYRISRRKLFAHELGHFIGIGHTDDSSDVMYPQILPGGDLTNVKVSESELQRVIP